MSNSSPPTKVQKWFHGHSSRLLVSFTGSELIQHNVTKGGSRESQILDTLSNLLPARISVERNVVIVDAADAESKMFDGVLADRLYWPLIFNADGTRVAMVESVVAAIEVKSKLDKSSVKDIFRKSCSLRTMQCVAGGSHFAPPLVTAFAYQCPNTNLSFFDFATWFVRAQHRSPSLVCTLNDSLFGLAETLGGQTVPADEPSSGAFPILCRAGEDALLVYFYFLSRWVSKGTTRSQQFRSYSDQLFSTMTCFGFDRDFLDAVGSDEAARQAARDCFKRKASADIQELYASARETLGLAVAGSQTGRQG